MWLAIVLSYEHFGGNFFSLKFIDTTLGLCINQNRRRNNALTNHGKISGTWNNDFIYIETIFMEWKNQNSEDRVLGNGSQVK